MKRFILLLTVSALLVLALALPASGQGNHYAKGQFDTNPGAAVNEPKGDTKNDVCFKQGACRGTVNN